MKILHWDEMFHPNFGYQINVLPVFQKRQGHEVIIVTAEKPDEHPTFAGFANQVNIEDLDEKFQSETGVKIIRLPIHRVISGRVIYKCGYINVLNSLNPDVIMCHTCDTLSTMMIIAKFKKINPPLVFDNHMLEMASANRFRKIFRFFYATFITPIIKKNKFVVIRTQEDPYVTKCLGIPQEQAPFISFGTDVVLFHPDKKARKDFREKNGIGPDDFMVIYAGKTDFSKNGLLLAKSFQYKFKTDKRVVLLLVTNFVNSDYGRQVSETIRSSENTVIYYKTQNYRDLARFYQAADLAVFPKQCSLSFFDVQACGLPVILENNAINIGRVQSSNGFIYASGDIDDFRDKIQTCIDMDAESFQKTRSAAVEYIRNNFDYTLIAQQYTDILDRERERQDNIKGLLPR